MQFAKPEMLNILWSILLVALFLWWSLKYRQKKLDAFVKSSVIDKVVRYVQVERLKGKNVLLVGVFLLSVFALARPQWGYEWQEIKRQAIDIIVVIDTSKSMLTRDVKPNRLERTKLAVKDLLKKLKGDRIGLIAFSGDAFLVCPLTIDYDGFLLSLDEMDTSVIPRGGTNISRAIEVAMKSYEDIPSKYKNIIIITDGENLEGDPLEEARRAKDMGVKIFTVGIGTREGELIQYIDPKGQKVFLKDSKGNFVKSRLNEEILKKIALLTDGLYVKASGTQFGLELIYDRELASRERREIEGRKERRYFERFQIPLGLALILLIWEICLPLYRKQS